ncbi:assembly factor cbp4, partial [Coemansia sp. RSA 2673]
TKELIIKQELIVTSAGEAKILLGKSGSKIKDIGRDAANNIAKALGIPTPYMSFRKGLVAVTGIMGVAVLLRYTIVPDEDKMIRSLSPELRAEYERNKDKRREQHDAIMAQIIENSKSDKPIWDVSSPSQAKRAADGSK